MACTAKSLPRLFHGRYNFSTKVPGKCRTLRIGDIRQYTTEGVWRMKQSSYSTTCATSGARSQRICRSTTIIDRYDASRLLHSCSRRLFSSRHRLGADRGHDVGERKPSTNDRPVIQTINDVQKTAEDASKTTKSTLSQLTPHENIYNLPNFLTVTRLIAAPATAYLLIHDHHAWALGLFAYAGITDLIDGWLARKWKLQTVAGSVIDPMADKTLMIILTVTLAIKGALPLSLAVLILGRDAALAIAAIYYRYASLPAPKTFARYWDFSLPSAQVHPTTVSKYNTFLQLILIGGTLALPVLLDSSLTGNESLGEENQILKSALTGLQVIVAGTTAWSGLSYAFLPKAVTILGSDAALVAKQGARGRAIIGVSFGAVVLAAAVLGYKEQQARTTSSILEIKKEES